MQKQAPTLARILTMAVFALSCFGLLLFLWLSFGGPIPLKPQGYRVQVGFPEATTLAKEADVRIAGVSVGRVRDLQQDGANNRTLATIELERKYAPLLADAAGGRPPGRRAGGGHRPARRDLRFAGPGNARGIPHLAAGSREGDRG